MTFRNHKAAALWIFAALWFGMLLLFTWVFATQGIPEGQTAPYVLPVLVLFWFAGLGLIAFAASKPCILVEVSRSGVVATWRFPHRVERHVLPRAQVERAEVVESKDGDGDPYFTARAKTTDGRSLDIVEGSDRDSCANICRQFNAALFGGR